MFTTGETVGLVEWIIDDTYFFFLSVSWQDIPDQNWLKQFTKDCCLNRQAISYQSKEWHLE